MLYKRIWPNRNSCIVNFLKKYSTVQNTKLDTFDKKPKKKKIRSYSASSEIISLLKENKQEHYLDFIPKTILRKTNKKNNSLYVINEDTAKELCSLIGNDLLKNASHVIENNPGLGFLTEKLLEIGVPTLHLYEKNQLFLLPNSPLSNLIDKYKNRLYLKNLSFTDVWLKALRDGYHCDNLSSVYLDDAPYFDWEDKSYTQIIMFLSEKASLAMIIHNFFNHTSLFAHGRPTFYVIICSDAWNKFNMLEDDKKKRRFYTQYNVLFNLFFDCHYFGKLPKKSFIPWPINRAKNNADEITVPMSVIKIEPKKNAFQILDKEDIGPFWYFLKYCMRSSKIKVIEQIEAFESGFGIKLIEKNIDITTTFKEMSPQKLLEIFKMYRASPGYNESTFMLEENQKNQDKEVEKVEEIETEKQKSLSEQ